MTPETVHCAAQLIRHNRAMLTSLEKWARSPSFSRKEVLELITMFRGFWADYEARLSAVDVDSQAS